MGDCMNPFDHRGCNHEGWQQCRIAGSMVNEVNAARDAARFAGTDLGLGLVRALFFEPGPRPTCDPMMTEFELVTLNAGLFDPDLRGKACHPSRTPMPTVWVRSGLSPVLTAAVVLHEARHVWQMLNRGCDNWTNEDEEADAESYMWTAAIRMGFSAKAVANGRLESAKSVGHDKEKGRE